MTDRDHRSRRSTEARLYDVCRESGVRPDYARHLAQRASEQAHRTLDRTHSAQGDRARNEKDTKP